MKVNNIATLQLDVFVWDMFRTSWCAPQWIA